MTHPDLAALAALLDKATPGPLTAVGRGIEMQTGDLLAMLNIAMDKRQCHAIAALIVAAVNALPDLIAYVRELERARDQATLNRACADALVSAAQDMTSAATPREPTQDECEKIRKRVLAEHRNDTGGGTQRAIVYQIALIRAGYEAALTNADPLSHAWKSGYAQAKEEDRALKP